MEDDREYLNILDLLYRIVEAGKEAAQRDEMLADAESLARKFFCHCASVLYLSRGTNISDFPSIKVAFFDSASVNVLARAALESFLTFHYIFAAPVSQTRRELRLYAWRLGGLQETQSFPCTRPETKRRQEEDSQVIQRYTEVLRRNRDFQRLSAKQRQKILQGHWKTPESWKEIALNAGLCELHAQHFYGYLCGYAHSGSKSVLHLTQADTSDKQRQLFDTTLELIKMALSHFISEYRELFPNSKQELERVPEARDAADFWLEVSRGLREQTQGTR
jgi:hypothetical protein